MWCYSVILSIKRLSIVLFWRPCLLGSNMGNYPWLADSWPTSNFTHTSKDSMTCCSGRHDSTDRYYNSKNIRVSRQVCRISLNFTSYIKKTHFLSCYYPAAGITNFLGQSDTYSPSSNDGPIYSTINPADEEHHDLSSLYSQGPDPYSSPVLSKTGLSSLGQDLDQWSLQSGHSTAEYAKLQYPRMNKGTMVKN